MNIVSLEDAYKFHPFYRDFKEQGFDAYICQTFLRFEDDAKIEVRFSGGINITPETIRNGFFIDKDTLILDNKKIKIDKKVKVNLSYIGIDKDEYKRQGRGSALLDWFVGLCDRYDYEVNLDIDTRFKTPIDVLENFYSKRDFVRVSDSHMIRPSKSKRGNEYSTFDLRKKLYLAKDFKYLLDKIESTVLDLDDEVDTEESAILYKDKTKNYLSTLDRDITTGLNSIKTSENIKYVELYRLIESLLTIIEFSEMEYEFEKLTDKINNLKSFTDILKSYFSVIKYN